MISVKSKLACIILSLTFLVQSCSIYKRAPITIDEAADTGKEVLIIRNDGYKFSLLKIEKNDGKYYGIKQVSGQDIKSPLNEEEIKKILVLDKSSTLILNTMITTSSLGLLFLFGYVLATSGSAF